MRLQMPILLGIHSRMTGESTPAVSSCACDRTNDTKLKSLMCSYKRFLHLGPKARPLFSPRSYTHKKQLNSQTCSYTRNPGVADTIQERDWWGGLFEGVGSAARYQVLARIGEEVLGEFWTRILVGFLVGIFRPFWAP
jgi:hypothetical protein